MLPRSKRISAQGHALSQKKGVVLFSEHLSLKITENPAKKPQSGKFSVVVSKKIEKKAVSRNKARRRVYAIIRDLLKKKEFPPSLYIFFIVRSIEQLSHQELSEEIDIILKKARI